MEIISEVLELTGRNTSYRCFAVEMPQLEPYWHSHPEFELSLVCNGSGLRFVGDHISKFSEGDLLLTGYHMPHDRVTEHNPHQQGDAHVIVLHLQPDFWNFYPEYQQLTDLLSAARYGVWFPNPPRGLQQKIKTLVQQKGVSGLASIMAIFTELTQFKDQQTISSVTFGEGQFALPENQRIQRINEHLLKCYSDKITQAQVADMIAMSPQAFSRWFKQIMNCTFIEHLNKIRIEKACLNLLNSDHFIAQIAIDNGFDSLSHFNRQFVRLKNCTPKQFRKQFTRRQ